MGRTLGPARAVAPLAASLMLAGLCSCGTARKVEEAPPRTELAIYRNLARTGAGLDASAAADMISDYRHNHKLSALSVDPRLEALAQAQADAMVAANRPAAADPIKAEAATLGYRAPAANLSAGYQTIAEAFSGWRESPAHNRVMLDARANRLGIATAYAPGTKYRVFWVLVVAEAAAR